MISYPELVSLLIHEKYSYDDENSLLRQRDRKIVEFNNYDAYCESCKTEAKRLISERDEAIKNK